MTRAAIYRRISSDREGRELGVERQAEDCRKLAERLGLEVVADYCDNDIGASTRSRKPRPEYQRMLADARAGRFEVIIAYTTSRLTRRPLEHEELIELAEQHGIQYRFVASPSFDLNTSAGRLIARILAANDAGEAEDISERIRRQKEQAASLGEWKGGRRPFGYEADGMTPRPEEADALNRAADAILAGASIRSTVREFEGLTTTAGRPIGPNDVRRMLLRPRNAGLMEHRGEIVGQAKWPPIMPEEKWRAVVTVLTNPARRTVRTPHGRRWLGTGIYECGVCGPDAKVTTQCNAPYVYYRCPNARHIMRNTVNVDTFVERVLIKWLQRPDALDELLRRDGDSTLEELGQQAQILRTRIEEAKDAWEAGVFSLAEMKVRVSRLQRQLDDVQAQMATRARVTALVDVAAVDDVETTWKELPLDRKRAVLVASGMVVQLMPAKRGRPKGWRPGQPYFDPDYVRIIWRRDAAG